MFSKTNTKTTIFIAAIFLIAGVCSNHAQANQQKIKNIIHLGGGVPVSQGGSGLGMYHQISQTTLNNISNSPLDSHSLVVKSFFRDPLRPLSDYSNAINLVKNSGRTVWARSVFFYDLFICRDGEVGCYQDNFFRPWDQANLDYAFSWYRLILQISKNSGAPGIFLDMEAYSDYDNYRVGYVAGNNSRTNEEVVARCKAIGAQIADETYAVFGNQPTVIWNAWFDPYKKYPDGYTRTPNLMIEGMLDRIVEKNYPITLVDGGGTALTYIHPSLSILNTRIEYQKNNMQPFLEKYGTHLALGGTIELWLDIAKLDPYTDNIIKTYYTPDQIEVKNINDFQPLLQRLFENYEYVFVYRLGDIVGYDEYALSISEKFRPVIRAALCGNAICEANRGETTNTCQADCAAYLPSDINQDKNINFSDLDILKTDFLKLAWILFNPRSDINTDGQCTVKDLGILLSNWGGIETIQNSPNNF